MAMNLTELESVLGELHHTCVGGWIQKIHQPLTNTLVLDIRVPGQSLNLHICADPLFARIHLTSRKLQNPSTPPPFCQFLRAHLESSRIEDIRQELDDRVVYIVCTTSVARYVLVVALTGNQSNLYLLDESKKVLQGLRVSWLKAGDMYSPPTRTKDPSTTSSHPRPSPQLSPPSGEGVQGLEFAVRYPVSTSIEQRYSKEEQDHNYAQARIIQTSRAKKALKQVKKKIKGLQEDLKKAEQFREYGRYGELLKGQLHSITKGKESVTVLDYYDPSMTELTLPLDSSKDPVWNMENYFKKHHKFLSAEKHLRPRLETAEKESARLQEEIRQIESGVALQLEDVTPISQEKRKTRLMSVDKSKKPQPTRAAGYRQFVSTDGLPLLVGKTAKDNDVLTFKVAGPDDLWLHARGTPGSHVVIRLEKGADPPHETLRDAATLALWFSDLRRSGKGEAIYTRRKFVKKAKGQKAGSVTVSREKSIWIEVKEERLERLKDSVQSPRHS